MTELIVNGNYSGGSTGWTPIGTGNVTVAAGAARSTTNAGGGGYAQSFSTNSNQTYTVSYDAFTNGTGTDELELTVRIKDASGNIFESQVTAFPDGTAEGPGNALSLTFTFTTPAGTDGETTTIELLETSASSFNRGVNWDNVSVTCFMRGTNINTCFGAMLVEELTEGVLIKTAEGTYKPLKMVLSTKLTQQQHLQNEKLRPIRILAGSLGQNLPERDLLISRQHRMLVQSRIAERMFGVPEILLPAIRLTALPGIFIDNSTDSVEYFHLLFERHEVIFAEGAPTESLFTGPQALKAVGPDTREEILTLFPEIAELDYSAEPVRFIPSETQQKQLVARHLKNNKPLIGITT